MVSQAVFDLPIYITLPKKDAQVLAEEDHLKTISDLSAGTEREECRNIPLHLSRFFPRYKMQDRSPTPVASVYALAETAREYLAYVYTGNC